jgi:predicted tellurium resistance membrane protein TerC
MSLDNTIAVAVTAKGNYLLLGLGLSVSIPIVIGGSAAIMWVLGKFPFLVWVGAMLLGWIAGDIFVNDPVLERLIGEDGVELLHYPAALLGAAIVLATSLTLRRRRRALAHKT